MSKVAVIGSGISGLTAAWLLKSKHDVTLYESQNYIGGHTHTHDLTMDERMWAVDSGFIVYNNKTYPNFIRLLSRLGIVGRPTTMSFSVKSDSANLEYNGTSLNCLFAQRRNLLRPMFWRMISGILKFNSECKGLLTKQPTNETLGDFLHRCALPEELSLYYIRPMAAAVWSMGTDKVGEMPIYFLARFFENHGFLNVNDRPQWYTIPGGSRKYVEEILKALGKNVITEQPVQGLSRVDGKCVLSFARGESMQFDHVIVACHSDQALSLLKDPTNDEREILGSIPYTKNDVLIHTDTQLLPKRRLAWAAWNYTLFNDARDTAAVTYNMNILQGLETSTPFLVSLNCGQYIDPCKVIKKIHYHHPAFTKEAVHAQGKHSLISAHRGTHYCGAYWFNGFHEDGVVSAMRAVKEIDPSIEL